MIAIAAALSPASSAALPRTPARALSGGILALLLLALASPAAADSKRIGPKRFEAETLHLVDVIGSIEVAIGREPKVEVLIEGEARLLDDISLRKDGKALIIRRKKDWLDFPERQLYPWRDIYPNITLRVPAGTAVVLERVIGEARIGDIAAPLKLDVSLLDAEVGNVSEADLKLHGRGNINLGKVSGRLSVLASGSSDLTVGDVGEAEIDKSGSGDISLGAVAGGLRHDTAGSGDTRAAAVNGPVEVLINGSGGLQIGAGEANPLRLRLNGSGDFSFDGTAWNPDVTVNGSGSAKIRAHRGTLRLRSFSGAITYDEGGGLSIGQ
ncbi:MAG: DUF2807 domain-containing protein [Kiloniellales bacterium]|nr:DUF2807 domain-containing protein [Kiloniellales bacterium]